MGAGWFTQDVPRWQIEQWVAYMGALLDTSKAESFRIRYNGEQMWIDGERVES